VCRRRSNVILPACSFEAVRAVIMKIRVFWILAWLSILKMGVMFLRNVGFSPKYMTLQPRKKHTSSFLHTFGKPLPHYNLPSRNNINFNGFIIASVHVTMFYDKLKGKQYGHRPTSSNS
jgi:hypothetical protein